MGKHSKDNNKNNLNKKVRVKRNNVPINEDILERRPIKKTSIPSKKQSIKQKKKKIHQKRRRFIFFLILIGLIIVAIWHSFSMFKWQSMSKDMLKNEGSVIVDTSGNTIAVFGTEKKQKNISSSEIPKNLKNAYVAIEDERFYKHHGVDIKRTGSAIVSYIVHFGSSSFGGSSITQQLVKNMTGNDSSSISRKVDEWSKAFELELCSNKDEILSSYLNIIYVGPNIYGVEMGAKYYFDKSASELSLEECAFLAGLNHSPSSYNPFDDEDNSQRIKKRTETVLNKMHDLDYISSKDYADAITKVEDGIQFKKGKIEEIDDIIYSYHTDNVISEVIDDIAKKEKLDTTFANNYLNMAGLKIYSTQNSDIQEKMEDEFEKSKYALQSKNDKNATSQAAMVVIDHKTGQVVGCVGRTW